MVVGYAKYVPSFFGMTIDQETAEIIGSGFSIFG
jgi:hypothetical protein